MKWQKYVEVTEANPWIQWHIGPPMLQSLSLNVPTEKACRQFREYIRTKVDYVAFRPFETLNFEWTNCEEFHQVHNPKYQNVKFWEDTDRHILIRFHIEGPDLPFARIRYVDSHVGREMVNIAKWHSEYWAKQGCRLVMGAVVVVETDSNSMTLFSRQRIQIYPFPSDWDQAGMMGFNL